MAKVEITRAGSTSLSPANFAAPRLNNDVGQVVGAVGEMLSNKIDAHYKAAEEAKAKMYVANESIATSARLDELNTSLKEKYNQEIQDGTRQDYSNFGSDLAKQSVNIFNESLKNAPNSIAQDSLVPHYASLQNQTFANGRVQEVKENIGLYTNQVNASAETLANRVMSDPNSYKEVAQQADALLEAIPSFMSPSDAAELTRGVKQNIAGAFLTGLARTDPSKVEDVVSSPEMQSLLDTKTLSSALRVAEAEQKRQLAEAKAAESAAYTNMIDKVQNQIIDGDITPIQLEQMRKNGEFKKPEDFLALESLWNRRNKDAIDAQESINFGAKVASGEVIADFNTKGDRAKMDAYFEATYGEEFQNTPIEERQAKMDKFIDSSGFVPTMYKNTFAGVYRGDANGRAQIARQIVSTAKKHPRELEQFKKEYDTAVRIKEKVDAGLTPQLATEMVDNEVIVKDNPAYKIGLDRFKEADSAIGFTFDPTVLTKDYNGWKDKVPFAGVNPESLKVPDALTYTWRDEIQNAMALHGLGHVEAIEYANTQVKKQWGITEIGSSPAIMMHSPESVVPHIAIDRLKADYNNEVAKAGHNPADTFLGAVPQMRTVNGDVTYAYPVLKNLENGVSVVKVKNKAGLLEPAYWTIDTDRLNEQIATSIKTEAATDAYNKRLNKAAFDKVLERGIK